MPFLISTTEYGQSKIYWEEIPNIMAGVTRRIDGLAGEESVAKKRKLENGNNQLQALKVRMKKEGEEVVRKMEKKNKNSF